MTIKKPSSKETLEFKSQIFKSSKGWSYWSSYPESKTSLRVVWARPKKKAKK